MTHPGTPEDVLRWYLCDWDSGPEVESALKEQVNAHPTNFESVSPEGVAEAVAKLLGWGRPRLVPGDDSDPGGATCFFTVSTEGGTRVIVTKQLPMSMGRPEDPAVVSAAWADKLLSLAIKYADAGFVTDAVLRLEAILGEHPEAPAAVEAGRLLAVLQERPADGGDSR